MNLSDLNNLEACGLTPGDISDALTELKQVGWLRLVTDEGSSAGAAQVAAHAASSINRTMPQTSNSVLKLPVSLLTIPIVAQ